MKQAFACEVSHEVEFAKCGAFTLLVSQLTSMGLF